jgi:hypothetical protein
MPNKTYAYIRSDIPEEEFVPTSEGYRLLRTELPVIEHNRLYSVLTATEDEEEQEHDLHLEVNGFANGVFVNNADFSLVEVAIPEKIVISTIHVIEKRKAKLTLLGYGRDEVIAQFEQGELDAEIAIAMAEQQDVIEAHLYFGDEIDAAA